MKYYYTCSCGNEAVLETDDTSLSNIKCYKCNKMIPIIKEEIKKVEVKRKK